LALFLTFISIHATSAAEPIEVFAGIPPVTYLVERIGGDRVKVETLIQPGQDPHTFEPTPKQIRAIGRAKIIFKVGMSFEDRLVEKIRKSQENIQIVDTTANIKKILATPCEEHDSKEKTHKHAEEDYDPHVWLSPANLKIQAANIAEALEKADAEHAEYFKANRKKFEADLDALNEKIAKRMKPFAGRSFFVYHPAFAYFAENFGLKQEAVQLGGKQPTLKQLEQLLRRAESAKAKVIFIQPQFDPRSAENIAQKIGGKVVPMNDMSKDVLANLQEIAEKIEQGMK
jgi:zinc transport system substrate-binding protein